MQKLGRKASKYRNWLEHTVHAEFKTMRNKYDKAIKYNKCHHWCDWLEKALDPNLWAANKYITAMASDGGKTRIPNLKVSINGQEKVASMNKDKADMLARVFFPSKPSAEVTTQAPTEYPPPACSAHKITRDQIRRQLK